VVASKKPARQGKRTGKPTRARRPLPRDPVVLRRTHAALHQFTELLEDWLDRALPAARARQLGQLRYVLQACRYLQQYVGGTPKQAVEAPVEKPSGLKIKPDLPNGLKQVDAEALAACINDMAKSANALAPFEGQPFKRKPVVIGNRWERAKARRRATAPKPTAEEAALAALEQQAQELLGVFREAVSRFSERLGSTAPRRTSAKTEPGASLTPPQLAKRLGVKRDKVRDWIKSGQLLATNVAKRPGGRPRYRIREDDVREFERKRKGGASPAPPRKRRKKSDDGVIEFF